MKKYLLWLTLALFGASLSAAPVSQASKDWVRREIAAAISAAGKATVVENADGTRTCSSPFTCETIPDAVSISLTFSPVRVIRNGVVTVVPFSFADLFIRRAFAQANADGEQPPDIVITIKSGFYVTKNLDNAGNPIAVDFNFGAGLELTLQTDKLPDMPSAIHSCNINGECFCKGYGKTEADFAAEAEAQCPNVTAEEFGTAYGLFDCWIDTDTWPDVTTNPKTKESRYWIKDVNDNRIALDVLDDTLAWEEGLQETLKDINSWLEECREAYCKSKICDKENPQHNWETFECGNVVWKKCRRNTSHVEGTENHEMAVGTFDAAFHFCACGKEKEAHTLSGGERIMKSDGTGWTRTTSCADGCGFSVTVDHTCKHEKCAPCSGGDGCDLPCPTCKGAHDFAARPTSGKCVRCACDGCGLTQRGAGVEVTREKHIAWDNCHWLETQEDNTRSDGIHCCCECGDYSHKNGTEHEREKIPEKYEQCASTDNLPVGKNYLDYHWVITASDCKFCGDKQGVLAEHQFDTPENGPTHKKIDNDKCALNRECTKCKRGKIETAEEAGGHAAGAYTEHTADGEVCRGWFICPQCQEQCYHDKAHERDPSKDCVCRNGCGYQFEHIYDQEDACGNKSCACGKPDPSEAESHDGSINAGEFHACLCGEKKEKHRFGNWAAIGRDDRTIQYERICISCSWAPSGCGAKENKESPADNPMVRCSGDIHIAKDNSCGCDCGEYGPGKPHGSTSFHHFGADGCLCDCEYLHREIESVKCPGICNFCARPAKAGIAAGIAKAPASMHTVCSVSDNRCGCKCGIVTHEIDDSDFHIFRDGECRCLGADGNGGKWHRHMPKSGCESICNGSCSWGYDGLHKVAAGDKVAATPVAAKPSDHTQAIGNRCGCECGEYTTSNVEDWKTTAALHKSNPADCGCYCDHAKESMLDDFHKYASSDDCLCSCEKEHTFKKGACESVCFGANHGSKYIAGWYGFQNPDAKNYHTPKTDACGCVCGEFTGKDYESVKHHNGTGTPSCRCECGRKHTPTEGNPCVELCNTCKLLATSGIVDASKLAPKDENHTFPAAAEYCGCACGAVTTPHKCAPGECYCYGHYAAGSTDGHNDGEPVLVKHIGLAATGNIVTNEKSCASCATPYEQYANEFKCINDHIVLGDFIGGKMCNHRGGCARNCDCCDHNETICECPWCNRVVGAVDYCTCAGSSRDRVWVLSGAKIDSNSILPLVDYLSISPIIEIIGDSSVREIGGDAFNTIHGWSWPDPVKRPDFSKLKSVQFNSVEKVGDYAFNHAFGTSPLLETFELNNVIEILDFGLYAVAPNIKRFNLPKLKTAGTCVFGGNPNLEEVVLPELLEMGTSAFSGCGNLRRVYAPKANMGYGAFNGCTKLEEVDISTWSTNGLFLGENDAPYNPLDLPSGCRVKCEEGWITVP